MKKIKIKPTLSLVGVVFVLALAGPLYVGLFANRAAPEHGQIPADPTQTARDLPEVTNKLPRADKSRECFVTGCNGELCSDKNLNSVCEFKPEYSCYMSAACERQRDGECGWTQTQELNNCLGEGLKQPGIQQSRVFEGVIVRIERESQSALILNANNEIVQEDGPIMADGGWAITLDTGQRIQTTSGYVPSELAFNYDISKYSPGDSVKIYAMQNEYGFVSLHCDDCRIEKN